MLNKYFIENILVHKHSLSWKISINFKLDEKQIIDLAQLRSGILSIKFDDDFSTEQFTATITKYVSAYSKSLAKNIQISISNQEEDTVLAPLYIFSGGLGDDQMITLITDVSQFQAAHSVLIFAFDSCVSSNLLLVKHRKRGWELPGGKLELNENEVDAIIRETLEEGAVELVVNSIKPIAQYQFFDNNERKIHIRTVFVGIIQSILERCLDLDTTDRRICSPPKWNDTEIFNFNNHYGPYLKDNVYPICLELAFARLIEEK